MTQQGWECPRCGVIYAPSVQSCAKHASVTTSTPWTHPVYLNPPDTMRPLAGDPPFWKSQTMCAAIGVPA